MTGATMLSWGASLERELQGADVVEFAALRRDVAALTRKARDRRQTIDNPAAAWNERVARAGTLAVRGVRLETLEDLRLLHGYVLEPALRSGTAVAIESAQRLTRLEPERFIDPEFEYAYTLERALAAAGRLYRGESAGEVARSEPAEGVRLDPEQRRAVRAHDGVVQVIAPAGSGKTAVLVERARELECRGVPAQRILCATFNRDARVELQDRLARAGLGGVQARTFHSIGWWLMREEGLARGGVGEVSFNQWRRLCAIALNEEGVWIDPADARQAIGQIKLGLLATAREYRRRHAGGQPDGAALARIYELYERHLVEQQRHDFDDLVLIAVRALREDDELRRRWQQRFWHVLVDEYQDIEPAQELLVRILAAPRDRLFCVGDEDQTLYGWRRASVRRMLDLDLAYPALERISLAHNYRCPEPIVSASRQLIEHNRVRFPKAIRPGPDRPSETVQALEPRIHESQADAALEVAAALAGATRGQIVVLARTTNLLRTAALACAQAGVRIAAPEQVFEPHGARGALEAYVRLCAAPAGASAEDVALVCRRPSRGLPFGAEEQVAVAVRAGSSFTDSLPAAAGDARQRRRLEDAGVVLDALASITDAGLFVSYLRGPGGLDEHFRAYEQAFGDTEQIELESLEQAQREAAGKTVAEYAQLLQARSDALRGARDDVHGIELTTIHRAKGREWPEVHVFGCEHTQLPHRRALEVTKAERAAGEGLEAERRLAYVAFTRAREKLVIHTTGGAESQFLIEAGVISSPAPAGMSRPQPQSPSQARNRAAARSPRLPKGIGNGPVAAILQEAHRVGLAYALRTASARNPALVAAATALEHGLIGPQTASAQMSVTRLLSAIEQLRDDERAAILARARLPDGGAQLTDLGKDACRSLARVLRKFASTA